MNKRFKPQHLSYNDDAHALVETLAARLGLTLKGSTGAKHRTILSSFLYCVREGGEVRPLAGQVAQQARTPQALASSQPQAHQR